VSSPLDRLGAALADRYRSSGSWDTAVEGGRARRAGQIITFDIGPDGRLLLVSEEATGQIPLALVEHWPARLEQAH
jgi:hypothetical protein